VAAMNIYTAGACVLCFTITFLSVWVGALSLPFGHVTPETLSTMFQTCFDRIPCFGNLVCFALLRCFDAFLAPPEARWFAIHAFANLFCVIFCTHGLFAVFVDPGRACDMDFHADTPTSFDLSAFGATSRWPIFMINATHFYHLLAFSLKADEKFHHFVFIPLIGIPGQIYNWGALLNYTSFFICGVPGGISYFNLVLVKLSLMGKLKQKKIDKFLNVWCRCPGLVVAGLCHYLSIVHGNYSMPLAANVISGTMTVFNGLYYCDMAVANYSTHLVLGRPTNQRQSKVTGAEVPVLKAPSHPLYEDADKAKKHRNWVLQKMGS